MHALFDHALQRRLAAKVREAVHNCASHSEHQPRQCSGLHLVALPRTEPSDKCLGVQSTVKVTNQPNWLLPLERLHYEIYGICQCLTFGSFYFKLTFYAHTVEAEDKARRVTQPCMLLLQGLANGCLKCCILHYELCQQPNPCRPLSVNHFGHGPRLEHGCSLIRVLTTCRFEEGREYLSAGFEHPGLRVHIYVLLHHGADVALTCRGSMGVGAAWSLSWLACSPLLVCQAGSDGSLQISVVLSAGRLMREGKCIDTGLYIGVPGNSQPCEETVDTLHVQISVIIIAVAMLYEAVLAGTVLLLIGLVQCLTGLSPACMLRLHLCVQCLESLPHEEVTTEEEHEALKIYSQSLAGGAVTLAVHGTITELLRLSSPQATWECAMTNLLLHKLLSSQLRHAFKIRAKVSRVRKVLPACFLQARPEVHNTEGRFIFVHWKQWRLYSKSCM
mmetsp:Transcript_41174/g.118998  ORF Transcript_41174/g.118998 Transcript_41174/m.118998 type:complete len:446 (+) Transcript_41174:660-1997(+)